MVSLDDIILGSTSQQWLEKNKILPSTWEFSGEHKKRIVSLNVGLLTMTSPGSAYIPSPGAINHKQFDGLVIIDTVAFARSSLTPREMIAVMLHEFGHHVPYPLSINSYMEELEKEGQSYELEADQFAIQCGYAKDLLGALRKFMNKLDDFSSDSVIERISRLEGASEASSKSL